MTKINKSEKKAYEYIKEKIQTGSWPPPTKINEQDISNALEISRSPVRNAIQRLAKEDYLSLEPYKGAFVNERKLSRKEFVERLQLLELLLTQHLFQIEARSYPVPYEELAGTLASLEKVLLKKNQNLEWEHTFIQQFMAIQPNGYYLQLVTKLFQEVLKAEFPEFSNGAGHIHLLFLPSMKKIIAYCQVREYPAARKEVRIFTNRLMLEILDQQL